jgi:hypothetical protein
VYSQNTDPFAAKIRCEEFSAETLKLGYDEKSQPLELFVEFTDESGVGVGESDALEVELVLVGSTVVELSGIVEFEP